MGLKQKALSGIFWTFSQQFSTQIIGFLVQIVLARLLVPKDFGLIAMLAVFISLGQMLMDSGMTTSLIRSKKLTQIDYSTVFFTNIAISTLVYLLIFFGAPAVANFYDTPQLALILRIYSLSFVIRSLVGVHTTKLTKELDFKTQMKLQVPSTIVGGIVGVVMALEGYGVWSLVWLQLSQSIVFMLLNWIYIKWRPTLVFSWTKFKDHFNFGYKITLTGSIDTIYNNMYNIFIGKYFSPSLVGFYTQAETLRLLPVQNLSSVLSKVTFPVFAALDGDEALKNAYKRTMKMVLFVIVPIMFFLILAAEPVILFLFGDQWLPAVPYFEILCIASIVRPIGTYNLNILKVKGRSDLLLILEIVKKTIGATAFFIILPYGILALIWLLTISSFLFAFLNGYVCGKLIGYHLKEQLYDFMFPIILGLISFVAAYFISNVLPLSDFNNFFVLLILGPVYFTCYISFSYLVNRPIFNEFKQILKN
ncbi:lipopolysaccharide biosynthesis protein [Flavobacteriaceae bacterium TP-CH-4]|uniref:Lipopolysaccharide biosynthesis protein n=1 Tax=Pelagihabitans pacificus TaxID=2696054 RepID=A0A967E711_9FLAO|nr:lipopolysaccharide biosynthesis protein [Pelagihabitans pacificus]NHF61082.1 lipopolysaccharide biosynthesis protein [Pelagihabitans pacificus]